MNMHDSWRIQHGKDRVQASGESSAGMQELIGIPFEKATVRAFVSIPHGFRFYVAQELDM